MTKIIDFKLKNYGNLRYELSEFFLDWEKFRGKKVVKIKTHIPYQKHFLETLGPYDVITTNKNERGQRNYYLYTYRHIHAICMPGN